MPFKLHGNGPKTLTISKKGAGEVTSADIQGDGDVEILDPTRAHRDDQRWRLAERRNASEAAAAVTFRRRSTMTRTFRSVTSRSIRSTRRSKRSITPSTKRVWAQNTEFDKLTIEVWTDGSVKPEDSIGLAAKLVKDHMSIFINFEEEEEEYKYEDIARPPLVRNDLLDRSVDELELSVRSYNCLKNADIDRSATLCSGSEKDMLGTKNFGKKSLTEIKDMLHGMGLDFGMDFDEQGNPIPGTGGGEIEDDGSDDDEFEAQCIEVQCSRTKSNMRHLKAHRKLGRTTEHRISMLRNLATSLINSRDDRIVTTLPKAKELRPFVEKAITLSRHAASLEGDTAEAGGIAFAPPGCVVSFMPAIYGAGHRPLDAARHRRRALRESRRCAVCLTNWANDSKIVRAVIPE